MSAQEELEKLERECRQNDACAGQHGDRSEEDEFNRIASQIAAIREGLGKAQEPVAWLWHYADGKTKSLRWRSDQQDWNNGDVPARSEPLYLATPADSAQDLPYVVAPKGGAWTHCTPELLNSGVDCGSTLRRACAGGGHDHYVVADSAQVLVDALEFYADPANYVPKASGLGSVGYVNGKVHDYDRGEKAKTALAAHKSEVKG